MFIITAKVRRRQVVLGAAALVVLCGAAVALSGVFGGEGVQTVSSSVDHKGVRTNEDRVAYLENRGWQVLPDPLAVEELRIPETFDESYDQYLEFQSSQGFDLAAHAGKRVKRYTYEITNYPTGEVGVQASLLVYKNTVIGGEVLSANPEGFVHGLDLPN